MGVYALTLQSQTTSKPLENNDILGALTEYHSTGQICREVILLAVWYRAFTQAEHVFAAYPLSSASKGVPVSRLSTSGTLLPGRSLRK